MKSNTIIIISFLLCFAKTEGVLAEIEEESMVRVGWPDYIYVHEIKGWLKLHHYPEEWRGADINCRREEAQLTSLWGAEFMEAINNLQSNRSLPVLYSGSKLQFPEGVFVNRYGGTEETLSLDRRDLENKERCGVVFANRTTGTVDCDQRLPYTCYAPAAVLKNNWYGYEFHPKIRGGFKLHSEPVDWQAARISCHDEEALLASPWTPDFTTAITELYLNKLFLSMLYSGAHVTLPRNEVQLVSNLIADSNEVRCTVWLSNGTLGNVDCKKRLPYVCYAAAAVPSSSPPLPPQPPPSPVPICDDSLNYKFSHKTRHCYKLHSKRSLWTDAYRICQDEGAYLAVINSRVEAQELIDLGINQYYVACPPYKQCYDFIAAIGFSYWKEADRYLTVHGTNLEYAGYDYWWQKNHDGLPRHGYMHKEGGLYDGALNLYTAFICEKESALS